MSDIQLMTREQARQWIKRAPVGVSFALSFRNDAPIEGNPDECFRSGFSGYVDISRKTAFRIIDSALTAYLEQKGARIRVQESRWTNSRGKENVTYWIGG